MAVFFFMVFVLAIVLIILDIRNIIKWRKEKKRKAHKLDTELANNVLKALAETDIKPIQDNLNKSVDDFAELLFKEDKKSND